MIDVVDFKPAYRARALLLLNVALVEAAKGIYFLQE